MRSQRLSLRSRSSSPWDDGPASAVSGSSMSAEISAAIYHRPRVPEVARGALRVHAVVGRIPMLLDRIGPDSLDVLAAIGSIGEQLAGADADVIEHHAAHALFTCRPFAYLSEGGGM